MPQEESPEDYTQEQAEESVRDALDATPAPPQEVELFRPSFSSDDMRNIASFDDAMALMLEAGITVDDAAEAIGDGFVLLKNDDKNHLVGVPLLFMTWSFSQGDFGQFVAARVVAKLSNGSVGKYVVTDGSAGIYKDLAEYTNRSGKLGGLWTMGGLSRSDYEVDIPDPKTGDIVRSPATTYYIDVSTK